ncbi:MAG TPA: oligopeptide/dipeptide ABC transporter ATP-binding protein [Pseudogracilibacillus sp.]|nr:oligopeptide/dipeptide ABC transporter ATP-binding protein [Pseudogracilibacillus sp.]
MNYFKGDILSPIDPPSGCVFHTRCSYAMEICKQVKPEKKSIQRLFCCLSFV